VVSARRTLIQWDKLICPSAALIADYLAQQLDSNVPDEWAAVLRDWAKEPDAMFAQAWFEATGYKG
jgi:hypothetical protein